MPPPALAEMRRGEQTVHDLGIRLGRRIAEEPVNLFGRGRQAGQVEVDTSQERDRLGVTDRLQALLLQASEKERIDRAPGPVRAFYVRDRLA